MNKRKEKQIGKDKSFTTPLVYNFTGIFVIIAIIFSCSTAQSGTKNTVESKDQNDTVKFQCEDWQKPSDDDVTVLLNIMRPLDSHEWHDCYGDWNCGKEGTVHYMDSIYNFRLDAAGFIVLFNKNEQFYFGCYTAECWSYFPSGAGTDCDSLGNSRE